MKTTQLRLKQIQTELKVTITLLKRLSLEVDELIEIGRQEGNESDTDLSVKIEEELLSTITDDETLTFKSDDTDLDITHSKLEHITSVKKSSPVRRSSRPLSGKNILSQVTKINTKNQKIVTPGPYNIGSFVRITNRYKGAFGTVGEVVSSQQVYTTIEDFFGNTHKREHHNFTPVLDWSAQKIAFYFKKKRKWIFQILVMAGMLLLGGLKGCFVRSKDDVMTMK